MNWPDGFAALEACLTEARTYIARLSPDQRTRLLRGEDPPPRTLIPRIGDREGGIEVVGHMNNDGGVEMILRGSFRFQWWPFGEWVVYDGLRIGADNRAESFSEDELAETW